MLGIPGGKVSILGGHSIGHSRKAFGIGNMFI